MNGDCRLTRRARGWHCCCDIPWITCETHSLVGFACGPRGGVRTDLSDPVDKISLRGLLPVQQRPPKSVVEAQMSLRTRLRTEEVVNRHTSSRSRIRRPTVSLMGSIRDNQPRPKRWPRLRMRPAPDKAEGTGESLGSSRTHSKKHTSRVPKPPVWQRPLSAQETFLAVGRSRAIEPFAAGLPLHIPQVTTSKDVQGKSAVALRMICDRVPETLNTVVNPPTTTSRVLRHMNSEEAHLFAERRDEPVAASSSSSIAVTIDTPVARVTQPRRTLGRFISEEAVKRL